MNLWLGQTNKGKKVKRAWRFCVTEEARFTPLALNQRSPAEGKGKGQKLLAQGNTLGNVSKNKIAL